MIVLGAFCKIMHFINCTAHLYIHRDVGLRLGLGLELKLGIGIDGSLLSIV